MASRGTAANSSGARRSNCPAGVVEHPRLGEAAPPGPGATPARRPAASAARRRTGRHLGQAALLPADHEHLHPVHAGVEVAVGRGAELVGLARPAARRRRSGRRARPARRRARWPCSGRRRSGRARRLWRSSPSARRASATRPSVNRPRRLVGPAVAAGPRVVEASGQLGQLRRVADQLRAGRRSRSPRTAARRQHLGVAVAAGGGQGLGAEALGLVVATGQGQGPGQRALQAGAEWTVLVTQQASASDTISTAGPPGRPPRCSAWSKPAAAWAAWCTEPTSRAARKASAKMAIAWRVALQPPGSAYWLAPWRERASPRSSRMSTRSSAGRVELQGDLQVADRLLVGDRPQGLAGRPAQVVDGLGRRAQRAPRP